jgi:hypothetical protein
MRETHANEGIGQLDAVETRRALLRRSGLLAGLGVTALLAGCTRGDDDDEGDTEPGVPEDSGLDKGAEDPGEQPGAATESGLEAQDDETQEAEDDGD